MTTMDLVAAGLVGGVLAVAGLVIGFFWHTVLEQERNMFGTATSHWYLLCVSLSFIVVGVFVAHVAFIVFLRWLWQVLTRREQ